MDWVIWAFPLAAIVHVTEEYYLPGGFPEFMRRAVPGFAPFVTSRFAIFINGLLILLCAAAALAGSRNPVFSLSIASLLLFNGLMHIGSAVRFRRYVPGLVSGLLLYIPLSIRASLLFIAAGSVSTSDLFVAAFLGILYQAIPIGYLFLASRRGTAE